MTPDHTEGSSGGSTRIRAGIVDVLVMARSTPAPSVGVDTDHWQVLVLRRGPGTRCTSAWEIVHGRIEQGERPDTAALREVLEETSLQPERLYSITVNPFYLVQTDSVELAIVFAAIMPSAAAPMLADEHDAWEWLSPPEAMIRLAWPRERDALTQALSLLAGGDAGPVEDVLRIR
jgi:8-oxo-dGTP pyrophosphatase MutT (NUDIX family)